MSRSRLHYFCLPAASALLLSLAGCQSQAQQTKDNPSTTDASVVATVNGDKISRDTFDQQLEARRGPEVLGRLVMEKLIEQEAKRQNYTLPDAELKAKLDDYHKDAHYKDDVKHGINPQLLDHEVEVTLLLRELMLKDVTEQDKLRFYDRFRDDLTQVQVAQILLTDKKEADRVHQDLVGGADFAGEARKYSKDPGSRDQGGVIEGSFIRSQLEPPLSTVAFTTPVGQISPVIQSPMGYHIIKVVGKKSSYDELKTSVEDAMLSTQEKGYEETLQAKATITSIYDKETGPSGSPATPALPVTSASPH